MAFYMSFWISNSTIHASLSPAPTPDDDNAAAPTEMPLIDPVTMSSNLSGASSSPPSKTPSPGPQPAIASLQPVALLDGPASQAIAHARPVALLALLALRFDSLVRDPVTELQASLPVVAGIQLGYAVSCLPIAGSPLSKGPKKARPGERKKADALGPKPIVSALLSLLLTIIVTPAVYILLVLFGAPFLTHTPQTFLLATHFSLLALFPVFYSRGLDQDALLSVAGALAPLDETFGALVGATLGSWLGAVPIPLDWDREWQKWPVTILVGLYAGATLGAKAGGLIFWGKRFVSTQG